MKKYVNQWGIYVVDFGKSKGSVQQGVRLAIILQNCIGNQFSPTTICVPTTTKHKNKIPTHYDLRGKEYDFLNDCTVLCEQVTTIDVDSQVLCYKGMLKDVDRENLYNVFLNNFVLNTNT